MKSLLVLVALCTGLNAFAMRTLGTVIILSPEQVAIGQVEGGCDFNTSSPSHTNCDPHFAEAIGSNAQWWPETGGCYETFVFDAGGAEGISFDISGSVSCE